MKKTIKEICILLDVNQNTALSILKEVGWEETGKNSMGEPLYSPGENNGTFVENLLALQMLGTGQPGAMRLVRLASKRLVKKNK